MADKPPLLNRIGMVLATTYIIPLLVFVYYEGQNSERLTNIIDLADTIYGQVQVMDSSLEEATITTHFNKDKLIKVRNDVADIRESTSSLRERIAALEARVDHDNQV